MDLSFLQKLTLSNWDFPKAAVFRSEKEGEGLGSRRSLVQPFSTIPLVCGGCGLPTVSVVAMVAFFVLFLLRVEVSAKMAVLNAVTQCCLTSSDEALK